MWCLLLQSLRPTILMTESGWCFVTELIETVPAAGNANYYAEVVQGKAALRNLIHAADDIAEIG